MARWPYRPRGRARSMACAVHAGRWRPRRGARRPGESACLALEGELPERPIEVAHRQADLGGEAAAEGRVVAPEIEGVAAVAGRPVDPDRPERAAVEDRVGVG